LKAILLVTGKHFTEYKFQSVYDHEFVIVAFKVERIC
jgi:hypothetical protein